MLIFVFVPSKVKFWIFPFHIPMFQVGTWIIYNVLLLAWTATLNSDLQKNDFSLLPKFPFSEVSFERGFSGVLEDLADPVKFQALVKKLEEKYLETKQS